MPKQGPSLAYDGEVVYVGLTSLNRTLCYIRRSICPPASKLPDPVPILHVRQNWLGFGHKQEESNNKVEKDLILSIPMKGDIVLNMVDHLD